MTHSANSPSPTQFARARMVDFTDFRLQAPSTSMKELAIAVRQAPSSPLRRGRCLDRSVSARPSKVAANAPVRVGLRSQLVRTCLSLTIWRGVASIPTCQTAMPSAQARSDPSYCRHRVEQWIACAVGIVAEGLRRSAGLRATRPFWLARPSNGSAGGLANHGLGRAARSRWQPTCAELSPSEFATIVAAPRAFRRRADAGHKPARLCRGVYD